MLTPTSEAAVHLAQNIERCQAPDGATVRFVRDAEGTLRITLDHPGANDTVFEHWGRAVLTLSPPIAQLIEDKTLAVRQCPDGPSLSLT